MKPCLLLVPEFTEVEWRIRPQLEQWATVRSFDPPGIGAEPPAKRLSREAIIRRGLDELDDWGCERVVVVADGWGIPTAAGIAARRRELVAGMALGHAKLSNRREGHDAPINAEIYAAMSRLIETDAPSFVRVAIAQVTGGSVDEEHAQAMLARLPTVGASSVLNLTAAGLCGGSLTAWCPPPGQICSPCLTSMSTS
jgi:pimeloyl-ACP methyl ester carboxylesterase